MKGDNTTNYYTMSKEVYNKHLDENIQKAYKKCPPAAAKNLIKQEKDIARKLDIDDRMDVPAESEAYVQLKDHKPNYRNNPTFRLLNPNKSELGKIAKQKLQNINETLRIQHQFNQWRKTTDALDWFKNLESKNNCHFIQFDICEFYPSISEDLLREAMDWAQGHVPISEDDKKIILSATNSVLYSNGQSWKKKTCEIFFDLTMGSFHGAERCKLVGLYILSKLKDINFNGGLYRDDGLGVLYGTKRQNENIKKKICDIFRKNNLKK